MDRRRFLKTTGFTGITGATVLAGCLGDDGNGGDDNGNGVGDNGEDVGDNDDGDHDGFEIVAGFGTGEENPQRQAVEMPWWETLEERSDGRLTVEPHYGGALGGTIELHNLAREGTIDMIGTIQHYFDIWEQHNAPNAPGIIDTQARNGEGVDLLDYLIAHNIEAMPNGFLYEDFQRYDIQMGMNMPNTTMFLITNEEVGEVSEPEDWEGLRLSNTTEMQAHLITELGATVDDVDYTEWYQAFDRGVVDGGIDPGVVVDIFDVHEVAPNIATNYSFDRYHNPAGLSLETYESMPDELQTVWDESSWEHSIESMYWNIEYGQELLEQFVNEGANAYEVPESTVDWQVENSEPVAEEFLNDIGAWDSYLRFVDLVEHISEERGDFEPETVDEQISLAPDDHPVAEWWADYDPVYL